MAKDEDIEDSKQSWANFFLKCSLPEHKAHKLEECYESTPAHWAQPGSISVSRVANYKTRKLVWMHRKQWCINTVFYSFYSGYVKHL